MIPHSVHDVDSYSKDVRLVMNQNQKQRSSSNRSRPSVGLVPDVLGSTDADASSELCRAWGEFRDHQALVFFDPGARANFITPQLAEKMGIKMDEMGPAYTASMAAPRHEGAVTPLIGKLRLQIQGYVGHEEFFIMPLEGCDVLLGMPWFYNHKMGRVKRPEWQYVDQVKACKKGQWTCKCKFCGHTWDGGPARIHYHLLKIAGHGVGPCDQVPDAVKEVVTRLHADARGDGTDRNDYVNELVNAMGEEASQSMNDATASTHASDSSKSKKRKATLDRDLRVVLDLASDAELHDLANILYGQSLLSPLLKSVTRGDGSRRNFDQDIEEREALVDRLESRFLYLGADAKETLRGWRPTYRDILLGVRAKLNVHCSPKLSTEDLEAEIFLHLLQQNTREWTDISLQSPWKHQVASNAETVDHMDQYSKNWQVALKVGGAEFLKVLVKGSGIFSMSFFQRMVSFVILV
ncbi:hypothetical protein L7F22_009192 [Adiantum nelumboides]|nr:hypothetical protein [Adiantum nelumboides]